VVGAITGRQPQALLVLRNEGMLLTRARALIASSRSVAAGGTRAGSRNLCCGRLSRYPSSLPSVH